MGAPYINPSTISFSNGADVGNYHYSDCFGNTVTLTVPCDYDYLDIKLTNLSGTQTISQSTVLGSSSGTVYITMPSPTPSAGQYMFKVRGTNDCGTGNWTSKGVEYKSCSVGGLLLLSPNPTSGETTVSIETNQPDENTTTQTSTLFEYYDNSEWELEIYDNKQMLKQKKSKIKTKSTKINTRGWKEGVYTIRAKYKNDLLFGNLVVKKN